MRIRFFSRLGLLTVFVLFLATTSAQEFQLPQPTTLALAWHPTQNWLVMADTDGMRLLDTTNGLVIDTFPVEMLPVYSIALSPDGLRLASGGANGELKIWDTITGDLLANLIGHSTYINAIAWNSDSSILMSSSAYFGGNYLISWDMTTYLPIAEREAGIITQLVWSHNNQQLFVSLRNGGTWAIDSDLSPASSLTYNLSPSLSFDGMAIALHPTNNLIAVGSTNGKIHLINVDTNERVMTLSSHTDFVTDLEWSADGTFLTSVSRDGTVKKWDLATGQLLGNFSQENVLYAVALSPDGTQLAYGGENLGGTGNSVPIILTPQTATITSLSLRDSASNPITGFESLENEDSIDLATVTASLLRFRATANPTTVGSVKFELSGTATASFTSNAAPYEMEWTPVGGSYTLTATPYYGADGTGTAGTPLTRTFSVTNSVAISSVSLVDPDTSMGISDFDPLEEEDEIDLATMTISPVDIIAAPNTTSVGSVVFNLDGTEHVDSTAPYQIEDWMPTIDDHTLTVTPYSGANKTGVAGTPLTRHFSVINSLDRIVYVSGFNNHIYIMHPDGSNLSDLETGDSPAWSPNGRQLVYWKSYGGSREIFVMDADGSNSTRLTTNAADDRDPAWSPDGTKIVYSSVVTNGDWEIYVMDASNGGNKQAITNNSVDDRYPSWSPDGTKIVFSRFVTANNSYDIYVMNANGSGAISLVARGANDIEPNWSHDGTKIVFTGLGTNTDIYSVSANGTNLQRLTNDAAIDQNASWTVDGDHIIFSSLRNPGGNNYFELYTMNTDGSDETRLTLTPGISEVFAVWGYP